MSFATEFTLNLNIKYTITITIKYYILYTKYNIASLWNKMYKFINYNKIVLLMCIYDII